jgi:hypothetical protein
MAVEINQWYEKNNFKKKRFRELFGRKPNKEEIKMLRKNQIDLGSSLVGVQPDNFKNIAEKIRVKSSGGNVSSGGV